MADAVIHVRPAYNEPLFLRGVGDWNGDGMADVLVGDGSGGPADWLFGDGVARVFLGPLVASTSSTDATLVVAGTDNDGTGVGAAALHSATGPRGLLVGASRYDTRDEEGYLEEIVAGRAGLVPWGATGSLEYAQMEAGVVGDSTGDGLGRDLLAAQLGAAWGVVLVLRGEHDTGRGELRFLTELEGAETAVTQLPLLLRNDIVSLPAPIRATVLRTGLSEEWIFVGLSRTDPQGNQGAVVGFPYSSTPMVTSAAPVFIERAELGARFGWEVESGDFDGDGVDDLAAAARLKNGAAIDSGAVYLIFGQVEGESWSLAEETVLEPDVDPVADGVWSDRADQFGYSVALVGDMDGDGFEELAIGAPGADDSGHGCVYLYRLPVPRDLQHGDWSGRICGTVFDEFFGEALAGAGDTNGDGYDDLMVGSRTGVYVFLGGPGY